MNNRTSTPQHIDNCQVALTHLGAILGPFADKVGESLKKPNAVARLSLSRQQLFIFAGFQFIDYGPILVVIDGTQKDLRLSVEALNHWSSLRNANHQWHYLSFELAEHEIQGFVVSELAKTFHLFLGGGNTETKHHFVVSSTADSLPIPSPEQYRKNRMVVTVGESTQLNKFSRRLVANGYLRYEKNPEPGGFQVLGERVLIKHPLLEGNIAISWRGSIIEQIIQHRHRRTAQIQKISIPPVTFPTETVPLKTTVDHMVVLKNSAANEIIGSKNIIYDSLHSDFEFPLSLETAGAITFSNKKVIGLYENHDRLTHFLFGKKAQQPILCPSPLGKLPLLLANDNTILIAEGILEGTNPKTPTTVTYERGLELLDKLSEGKAAVHADHGIGIYEGLQERTINNTTREYLILRYAAGDTLSVPVEYANKVSAYVGEGTPIINRLGGTGWKKVSAKALQDAAAFARELLATAGKRAASTGHRYLISPENEVLIDRSFPFELTVDQRAAWESVKADMGRDEALDHLVVGDVGFGKTEIAVRAAWHAASAGKQVALLAPTTLLVQQHADTFRSRLPMFASQIGVLSRFASVAERKQVRDAISSGKVSIAIGTHALLAKATQWHNLSLVIIDEEQRFGVAHKEHFKKLRAQIDILSLSATPIPRTLSMALAGMKQLSVISTPPKGRKSIQSFIGPDTDETLTRALTVELSRGGQVYLVSPQVRQLPMLARRVSSISPQAQVAIAHGQLPPGQLAKVMQRFDAGRVDVLVCSTIVESGLDVPNANTMIVMQSTHHGLADLYQLRGRVGRRYRQGFAYFLYRQQQLSAEQRKRLAALTEATRLGSGWALARHDLEIRGAGNLLGAEQSGAVNAVGAQLYLDMVRDAADQQQKTDVHFRDVELQLPLPATIPTHYIADANIRTDLYQRLSRASDIATLANRYNNIVKKWGDAPPEMHSLYTLFQLKLAAAKAGISRISSTTVSPPGQSKFDRISLETINPEVLKERVSPIGNWVIRANALILDMDNISDEFIERLLYYLDPA